VVIPDPAVLRRCATKIRGLDIPDPFDLDRFCEQLSTRRGRPIRLVPFTAGTDGPCGLWISTDTVDIVYHEQATTPLHREHIVLHEIGHLVFAHTTLVASPSGNEQEMNALLDEELTQQLAPDLDPTVIRHMLGRTAYASIKEQEAETFATLVLQHDRRTPSTPELAGTLGRIAGVWGCPTVRP